jgi:hypothetical protein
VLETLKNVLRIMNEVGESFSNQPWHPQDLEPQPALLKSIGLACASRTSRPPIKGFKGPLLAAPASHARTPSRVQTTTRFKTRSLRRCPPGLIRAETACFVRWDGSLRLTDRPVHHRASRGSLLCRPGSNGGNDGQGPAEMPRAG